MHWHLSMNDTFTSGHPLHGTRSECTMVACAVLVSTRPLQHVSHGCLSTVRVVWEPLEGTMIIR
jgi:prephenate dehydrogenase